MGEMRGGGAEEVVEEGELVVGGDAGEGRQVHEEGLFDADVCVFMYVCMCVCVC
jgi:hypothetical protein